MVEINRKWRKTAHDAGPKAGGGVNLVHYHDGNPQHLGPHQHILLLPLLLLCPGMGVWMSGSK